VIAADEQQPQYVVAVVSSVEPLDRRGFGFDNGSDAQPSVNLFPSRRD